VHNEGIHDENMVPVRIAAVRAAAREDSADSRAAVVSAVEDPSPWVSCEAIDLLRVHHYDGAIPVLIRALMRSETVVQQAACETMAECGDSSAVMPLQKLFAHSTGELHAAAGRALERLGTFPFEVIGGDSGDTTYESLS
jgi:HEAT repeat protein